MATAGLGFSSSLPLSFEAPARRTAIVAGMLALAQPAVGG